MLVFSSLGRNSNEFRCVSKPPARPQLPETFLSQDEIENNCTHTRQVWAHTRH